MWLFGIETSRPKIKTQEAFDKLEPKNNAIIGAENMSYAPHFMPNYREAFAFAEKEVTGKLPNVWMRGPVVARPS